MTLYSRPLGAANLSGVSDTTVYTVPAGGGPAIVRSATLDLTPGAQAGLYVISGGVVSFIVFGENTGTQDLVVPRDGCYIVLEPGDEIHLDIANGFYARCTLGGYQFSTP